MSLSIMTAGWQSQLDRLPIKYASRAEDIKVKIKLSAAGLATWKQVIEQATGYKDVPSENKIKKIAKIANYILHNFEQSFYVPKSKRCPRALFIDPVDEAVFIFSTKKGDVTSVATQKVYDVLQVSCLQRVPQAVRILQDVRDTFDKKLLFLETKFSRNLVILSRSTKSGERKLQVIQEQGYRDLDYFQTALRTHERIELFAHVLASLQKIFDYGFCLANIDSKNVLARKNVQGVYEVAITNFSSCYNPAVSLFKKAKSLDTEYGNPYYTDPVHFSLLAKTLEGVQGRGRAEDMFALGCLFLRFTFNRDVFQNEEHAWEHEWYETLKEGYPLEQDSLKRKVLELAVKLLDPNQKTRMTLPDFTKEYSGLLELAAMRKK